MSFTYTCSFVYVIQITCDGMSFHQIDLPNDQINCVPASSCVFPMRAGFY